MRLPLIHLGSFASCAEFAVLESGDVTVTLLD